MNNIIIENISKSYEDTIALNDISFEVNSSELFGLIGPDGAGKTSLLRILATLLLPDSGIAKMMNLDVVKDYKNIRHRIGYMPQRFSLYPDLSVKENLTFFASVFNTTIDENYDLIKDIYSQIEMFSDRRAGNLSGGMKQKLGLSCALIHKPDVLILDEPTTGVDAVSRKEFWEILTNLKAKGITIIVSTPYMDEAELCDRVALVEKGKILSIDDPKNLPASLKEKIYEIKSKNLYGLQKILRLKFGYSSTFLFGQSIHFSTTDKLIDEKAIITELSDSKIKLNSIKEIIPTTEDCFMSLMDKSELS